MFKHGLLKSAAWILAILFACSAVGSAEITLKLVMWTYGVETVLDNIAKFEALYPDIHVEVEDISWYVYPETLAMRFISGEAPDVLYVNDQWLAEWADAGWIVPFSDYFPDLAKKYKPLMKQYVQQCLTYDGKLWGLPYYVDTYVMMVNGHHLAEAGIENPPQTWEELTQQCLTIKEAAITPYPFISEFHQDEHSLTNIFFAITYSIEPQSLFDDELNPIFAKEGSAAYQALQWLQDAMLKYEIFDPASLGLKEIDVYKAMQGGRGTFTIMEKYTLGEMNAPGSGPYAGEFELLLMPGPSHATVGSAKFYAMTRRAVERGAEVIDACGKLIEFLGGGTNDFYVTRRWAIENALGFAYPHLYDDPAIQESINKWGNYEVEREQEALAVQMEGIQAPCFGECSKFLRLEIHTLLKGEVSVMQALEELAQEWSALKATY